METVRYNITTWNKRFEATFLPALEVLAKLDAGDDVEPVLDSCTFISPITLMAMMSLSSVKEALNGRVILETATGPVGGFASFLDYPTGFDIGPVNREDLAARMAHFENKSYHPIIQLTLQPGTAYDSTVSFLQTHHGKLVRAQLQANGLPKEIYSPISYMVEELTQNLLQHSRAEKGYMALQLYPNLGFIDLAFSDSGKGFLNSYQHSYHPYPEVVDDETAIRAALDQKSTKDQPTSTGYGIYTTRRMLCHGLGGHFFMWSGRGFYINNRGKEQYGTLSCGWPGSLTVLRIFTVLPTGFDLNNYVS